MNHHVGVSRKSRVSEAFTVDRYSEVKRYATYQKVLLR